MESEDVIGKDRQDLLGGRVSSGCSRLKFMISARECTFVILNWRMKSERHSLNSESIHWRVLVTYIAVYLREKRIVACIDSRAKGDNIQTTGSKLFFPSRLRLFWLGSSTGYTTSTPISIKLCTTVSYFWSYRQAVYVSIDRMQIVRCKRGKQCPKERGGRPSNHTPAVPVRCLRRSVTSNWASPCATTKYNCS